ncbi:MAG: hypothetical protein NT091_04125 [Candidatus Falkowbacteria bacterium]|nr:hypothetical protein [Candidatus Falkowbacteria bacterium]
MKKGKLIVIYGINNIGKSTQAKLLVGRLISLGLKAEYIKYPLYDIEPSGEIINGYLRLGNQYRLSPREVQLFYSLNRTQAETMVMQMLDDGVNIVAEDYTGTGVAWGIGNGVSEEFLKKINSHLLVEDSAILLDGNRYKDATEDNHKHETDNNLIENVHKFGIN